LEGLLATTENQPISYKKVIEETPQLVAVLVELILENKLLSL
jgi:hypothetical protein